MKVYRGYNKDYPNWGTREGQNHIWTTDDIEYAIEYANIFDNGGVVEFEIDDSKVNYASEYDYEDIIDDEFGGDPIDADNQTCQIIRDNGYNVLYFENGKYDVYLILDKNLIKSAREIDIDTYFDDEINEVLKNAGVQINESKNNLILYHSSNTKFNKFDIKAVGSNPNGHKEQCKGLWFTNSKKYASQYGKILYTCEVDGTKLLNIDSKQYYKLNDKFYQEYSDEYDFHLEGKDALLTQQYIVDNGYTGVWWKRDNETTKVYIIFDDSIINIIDKENNILNESIFWKGERISNFDNPYIEYNNNKNYDKSDEMIIWKNPSAEWVKYQLNFNKYFRFVFNSSSDTIYMWYGDDGLHRDTMDITGIDGDIVGTMEKNAVKYWIYDDTPELEDKMFRNKREEFLKIIYPNGYNIDSLNELTESPISDEDYDNLKIGDKVVYDNNNSKMVQPSKYDSIVDKDDDTITTQTRHHGGQARTNVRWNKDHFKRKFSLKESISFELTDDEFVLGGKEFHEEGENIQVFNIYNDTVKIGMLAITEYADNSISLDGLKILPKFRKQGFGKQVVDILKKKYKSIYVRSIPSAKKFWKKQGHDAYYNDDSGTYDGDLIYESADELKG